MYKSRLRFAVYILYDAGRDRLINARVSCVYISLDIISRNRAEVNRSIVGVSLDSTARRKRARESTDVLPPALSIRPPTPFHLPALHATYTGVRARARALHVLRGTGKTGAQNDIQSKLLKNYMQYHVILC